MRGSGKIVGGAVALLLALSVAAAPAGAANTRVSITDFKWSQSPTVNLGESVTWDWLGPDTMHSITGQAPNATQWDSDPTTSMPNHSPGSTYKVTFDQPGQYLFVCKVHSSVRGTVTVTDQPGDPNSDPGPQPPINFDGTPPTIEITTAPLPFIGPHGHGIPMEFASDERGIADADYYKLVKKGKKGKKKRTIRKYMGYSRWETYIGYNEIDLAAKGPAFRASPGKYKALFRVTDLNHNVTQPTELSFTINKVNKKDKKKGKKGPKGDKS